VIGKAQSVAREILLCGGVGFGHQLARGLEQAVID